MRLRSILAAVLIAFAGQVQEQTGVGQLSAWAVVGNPTSGTAPTTSATLNALLVGAFSCSTNPSIAVFTTSFACATVLPTALIPSITGGMIASNTVAFSNIVQGGAFSVICNPTAGTANLQACTPTQFQANILCAPNVQVFTSGSSATYTTPTCNSILPLYIEIEGIGGGGGAPGSGTTPGGSPASGGNTTVVCGATTLTGNGGGVGTNGSSAGGAGGTATGGDENITGGAGGAGEGSAVTVATGTAGGVGFYGGAGAAGANATQPGGSAAANTGAGGGAAGTSAGVNGASAGGAGGFFRKLLTSPPSTCTYTVGTGGPGGTNGTSGANGGAGAAGRIKFTAKWQ